MTDKSGRVGEVGKLAGAVTGIACLASSPVRILDFEQRLGVPRAAVLECLGGPLIERRITIDADGVISFR